ncbi:MAG: phospholipid carrier-dependent glycosyltransferase [Syntrophobacteraceae bacterium]
MSTGSSFKPSLPRREIAVWCFAALLLFAVRVHMEQGPRLGNDSYEYLSVAANFAAGHAGYTSIVYYDEERSHGVIPAPVTTFPIGYPAAIAAIAATGIEREYAALAVGVLSSLALIPLFVAAATFMEAPGWFVRVALLLLVVNSSYIIRASFVMTEPLFTAVTMAAVTAFAGAIRYDRPGKARILLLLLGSLFLGLAFWVRYAGLFLFVGTALFFGWEWLRRRTSGSFAPLPCLSVAALIIGMGLLRNQLVAGAWMGGNSKHPDTSVVALLKGLAVSIHELLVGKGTLATLAGVVIVLLLLAAARELLRGGSARRTANALYRDSIFRYLALYVVISCCALIYLGLTSPISIDSRMLHPLLPVILLLCLSGWLHIGGGAGNPPRTSALTRAAFVVICIVYAGANLQPALTPSPQSPHLFMAGRLGRPLSDGQSAMSWIDRNIPRDATILTTDGMATGYLLQRPTVSLAWPWYSEAQWTETEVRETMERFSAAFLILSFRTVWPDPAVANSAFLSGLRSGPFPPWLELRAENDEIKIFSLRSTGAHGYGGAAMWRRGHEWAQLYRVRQHSLDRRKKKWARSTVPTPHH